jgi:hypothetical protein
MHGWSTCAYSIYSDPAVAKFAFSVASTGATYVLALLL